MIYGDLARASQARSGMPKSIGVMSIKTANRTILEASLLPTPRALWDSFWYEGELSCLFADSNVGKSILAVQIADRIARTDNVMYLDFECPINNSNSDTLTNTETFTPFPKGCIGYHLTVTHCWRKFLRKPLSAASSRWHCKPPARFLSLTTLPICAAPWRKVMPQGG